MYWILRRISLRKLIDRFWYDFYQFQIQRIFTRSSMRELDLFRSRILFHMSLQIFQRENIKTSFVVFDQLRLKDFSFIDSKVEFFDHIFMSNLVMKRVVFVRDFVSFYEIDIMSYCMKFKKIKMIFFDFALFETWVTKDFLVRVKSKNNLITIIQCWVIMRFILSDENEVYQNLNKIHRMKLSFDHQKKIIETIWRMMIFCFFPFIVWSRRISEKSSNRWKKKSFEIKRLISRNQINQSFESFVFCVFVWSTFSSSEEIEFSSKNASLYFWTINAKYRSSWFREY
jgi:hypothetical protein